MRKITLYGIPNCDATKKAMSWLNLNNISFIFHDYKQQGISKEKIVDWHKRIGWENFFNKRSTTWRSLSKAEQDKVVDLPAALKIMLENNSIIKRPVIEYQKGLIIGFDENEYKKLKI